MHTLCFLLKFYFVFFPTNLPLIPRRWKLKTTRYVSYIQTSSKLKQICHGWDLHRPIIFEIKWEVQISTRQAAGHIRNASLPPFQNTRSLNLSTLVLILYTAFFSVIIQPLLVYISANTIIVNTTQLNLIFTSCRLMAGKGHCFFWEPTGGTVQLSDNL